MASKWCFAEFIQARSLGKPIVQLLGADRDGAPTSSESLAPIAPDLQQLDLRQARQAGLEALARQLSELALDDQGGFPLDPKRHPPIPACSVSIKRMRPCISAATAKSAI
jgi:hypothetical protein